MPDPEFDRCLRAVLATLALDLSGDQLGKLFSHFELLQRWNRRISLTSIRTPSESAERHFGESLFLARNLPEKGTLADVGSGAGFPGIPVATIRPGMQVTLIESVAKKATFLKEVTRDYRNVRVLPNRVEMTDGQFDWVTMRAVAPAPLMTLLSGRAKRLALLVGDKDAEDLTRSPLFDWKPPIRVPWGDHRLLLIGNSRNIPT